MRSLHFSVFVDIFRKEKDEEEQKDEQRKLLDEEDGEEI